jgi:hypothetical protein
VMLQAARQRRASHSRSHSRSECAVHTKIPLTFYAPFPRSRSAYPQPTGYLEPVKSFPICRVENHPGRIEILEIQETVGIASR